MRDWSGFAFTLFSVVVINKSCVSFPRWIFRDNEPRKTETLSIQHHQAPDVHRFNIGILRLRPDVSLSHLNWRRVENFFCEKSFSLRVQSCHQKLLYFLPSVVNVCPPLFQHGLSERNAVVTVGGFHVQIGNHVWRVSIQLSYANFGFVHQFLGRVRPKPGRLVVVMFVS